MVLAIIQMQQVILSALSILRAICIIYLSTHPKDIRSRLIKDRQMLKSIRLQQVIILPSILVRMLIST